MQSIYLVKRILFSPRHFLKLKSSQDIVNLVHDSLNETGFTFFFKRDVDNDMLRTKGSLWIDENNLVQEYEDKPQEDIIASMLSGCLFSGSVSLIIVLSLWRNQH